MKHTTHFLALGLCLIFATSALAQLEYRSTWGIPAEPGVVNPACRSDFSDWMSLAGEWDFQTDTWFLRWRKGKDQIGFPFEFDHARKIQVPGAWEAQGVGEPGKNQTWDCDWDCFQAQIRHRYMGAAAYKKNVQIPEGWSADRDRRVFLKIGGVRAEAYVWVNSRRAAYVNNYCGTYRFDVTDLLKPGESNEILAFVRNDVPSRKGLLSVVHAFGGFYRDLELESVPASAFLSECWVESDFPRRAARVHIELGGSSPTSGSVMVSIRNQAGSVVEEKTRNLDGSGELVLTFENLTNFWTPETPHLYTAEIQLRDAAGNVTHGWVERFGVRELKVVGDRFYLNGQPYFLRGSGDHNYDVRNLVEPPNRETFVEHLQLYRAAGFNFLRHHTHCPIPEYFEAADEVGVLLMPELPYYHDVPTEGFLFDPLRDLEELYRTNRRYVSYAAVSTGNEGFLGSPTDVEVYQWCKKHDPARLMEHQDGGKNTPGNSDFYSPNGYGLPSSIVPWPPGTYDDLKCPFVAHEYLNLAIKPNPFLESRYDGALLPPRTLATYESELDACGLAGTTWGERCIAAGERLQGLYQKRGIESARLDPACDGYSFWSMTDAGAASQGYLTQFWEVRENGLPPAEFRHFNGPTALLLKLDRNIPIATVGEKLTCAFHISHFGQTPIPAGELEWHLGSASGKVPVGEIPVGTAGCLSTVEITVPAVPAPTACAFTLSIGGTKFENRWNFWIFPVREKLSLVGCCVSPELAPWFREHYTDVVSSDSPDAKPSDILILSPGERELHAQARQAGRTILALSPASPTPDIALGWWSLGTQIGTAFDTTHPALRFFPTGKSLDELWFRLIRQGARDLREPNDFQPIAVGEGASTYYLYLGESRTANTRELATFALDLRSGTPESLALLDSLIRYLQETK